MLTKPNRIEGKGLALFVLALLGTSLAWASPGDPPQPRRIVSTAPSVTEMIYALGAEDRLVGVTSYCDYPPQAQSKTIIGDFASPNVETVLNLRPDLVVLLSDRDDILDKFAPFGIPTLVLKQETLEDLFRSLHTLGDAIGCAGEAAELARNLKAGLQAVGEAAAKRAHPGVLFVVSRDVGALTGIYSVGKGSYIDELIEIAGGRNILASVNSAYPKVSVEEVMARNPDLVIDMSHGGAATPEQVQRVQRLWAALDGISAVRHGRVYALENDVFIVPGPRVVEAAQQLRRIFQEFDEP